jgi:hypothetical protein
LVSIVLTFTIPASASESSNFLIADKGSTLNFNTKTEICHNKIFSTNSISIIGEEGFCEYIIKEWSETNTMVFAHIDTRGDKYHMSFRVQDRLRDYTERQTPNMNLVFLIWNREFYGNELPKNGDATLIKIRLFKDTERKDGFTSINLDLNKLGFDFKNNRLTKANLALLGTFDDTKTGIYNKSNLDLVLDRMSYHPVFKISMPPTTIYPI